MADRSVVYRLRAEIGQFRSQMSQAGASTRDVADRLTGMTAEGERSRAALSELGDTAGKVALSLGAAFAASVVKAANFEQSMSFVQAATHESAAAMEDLRKAAIDAGASTVFSATESASAIEELAKAGVSTAAILNGGLQGALDLAAAGGLEVADAAEAAASAMTQFKLSGEQVPHIADLLAAGAGKAQGSVQDMSSALNQSGLVAAQTGLTIEETTGALSAFASAGLTGSDAGTSFKTMLQALTPTSLKAKNLMTDLGISAYDAQGNFVGLTEFAGSLREGLSSLSVEQQNAALKTIFGSDAVRAAAVLYDQGAEGIQQWIDKTNDAGYASETAAIRLDNLKGDVEQLGGAFETLLIGGGEGQTGFLRELTQVLTTAVDGLNALPGPVKTASASLVGLAALGAGGFWLTTKAISAIAATRAAMAGLTASAVTARRSLTLLNGVKFAGITSAALIAIPLISNDIDTMSRSMSNAKASTEGLDGILEALGKTNVGKYADDLGVDMQKLAEDLYANGKSGEYVAEVYGQLAQKLDSAGDNFKEGASYWVPGWTSGQNKAAEVTNGLNDVIANNADLLGKAADESRDAAVAQAGLTGSTLSLADAQLLTADQVEQFAEQLEDVRKSAYETADGFRAFGDSLNDSEVSLGSWLGEMEKQAKALREFTANSKKAAKEGLDQGLIASLQEAGTEGALRMEQLANASDSEIKRANKAFRSGQRASEDYAASVEDLARELLGLPPNTPVNVTLNDKGIAAALERIRREAQSVAGDYRINYIITQSRRVVQQSLPGGRDGDPATPQADGGSVPKTGQPYADRHPYLLADGEEVISNRFGQADKHRALLKAINAGRLAEGGTAGGRNRDSFLLPAGLGGLDLGKGLRGLNRALKESEKALDAETSKRDDLVSSMSSLSSSVAGKFTTDLFGATNPWGTGGSISDALGILTGDTNAANAFSANRSMLQSKGLDGAALADLLANGDAQTIANFAGGSAADLARFESAYNQRQSVAVGAGGGAASAAFGAQLAESRAQTKALSIRLKAIETAVKQEHKEDRRSRKRGAAQGSRNGRKG